MNRARSEEELRQAEIDGNSLLYRAESGRMIMFQESSIITRISSEAEA